MVVFKIYLARSNMGTDVSVGVSVAVGKGVIVAVGMEDTVGVSVEAGKGINDLQEEKNERRKMERTMREMVVLFRMDCILPRLPFSFETQDNFTEQKPSRRGIQREGLIPVKTITLQSPFYRRRGLFQYR